MKTNLNPLTLSSNAPMHHSSHLKLISSFLRNKEKSFVRAGLFCMLFLSSLLARSQANATNCCQPSFGEVTLYYSVQAGSNFGFGMEAGNWNKESSRFSYFLGTKMQWYRQSISGDKLNSNNDYINFYLYVKGQFRIVDELFVVATPQILNLNTFDLAPGLRYVFPVANGLGVGLEPAYSIVQKQFTLSANIHIAL